MSQASDVALQRIKSLWNSQSSFSQGRRVLNREELEKWLNDGEPFKAIQDDNRHVVHWADPVSGSVFELRFRNDE